MAFHGIRPYDFHFFQQGLEAEKIKSKGSEENCSALLRTEALGNLTCADCGSAGKDRFKKMVFFFSMPSDNHVLLEWRISRS